MGIYGCVRGTSELARTDVGILALAPHPRKHRKNGEGKRDAAAEIVGIQLTLGDYVYADSDGVIAADVDLLRG